MKNYENVEEREPLLVVISGTSGAGKDSVIRRLKERDLSFHFVVTTTSRKIRKGEVEGTDYFFVTEEEFRQGIKDDKFLEHAIVYKQYKGVAKKQVKEALESGVDVLMRLNVAGAATIKSKSADAILIFITTVNQEELIARLSSRSTDTQEQLETRLRIAKEELEQMPLFDYKIINYDNQLEKAVDQIVAIIEAEHLKVHKRRITL
jgi:guanylate kinase